MRPSTSFAPPGAAATTMRMDLEGNAAAAGVDCASVHGAAAAQAAPLNAVAMILFFNETLLVCGSDGAS